MLEKIKIPENCIKNADLPLTKVFSPELIENCDMQECKLYASINYDLLKIQQVEKTDPRYNEIHFIYVKVSKIKYTEDIYMIVKSIYKKIKYQTVVIIRLNNMTKLCAGFIVPGKRDSDENIVGNSVSTQWMFDDFETKEIKNFFNELNTYLENITDVKKLYVNICRMISSLDCTPTLYGNQKSNDRFIKIRTSCIEEATIKKILKKFLSCNEEYVNQIMSVIHDKTFNCIYKHQNVFKRVVETVVYPMECVFHSFNKIEELKHVLSKYRITTPEELYLRYMENSEGKESQDFLDFEKDYEDAYSDNRNIIQEKKEEKIWDDVPNDSVFDDEKFMDDDYDPDFLFRDYDIDFSDDSSEDDEE